MYSLNWTISPTTHCCGVPNTKLIPRCISSGGVYCASFHRKRTPRSFANFIPSLVYSPPFILDTLLSSTISTSQTTMYSSKGEFSVAEVVKFLHSVGTHTPNVELQNHALNLAHDFGVFQKLKKWSTDIIESTQGANIKAKSLENLRLVGNMALQSGFAPFPRVITKHQISRNRR